MISSRVSSVTIFYATLLTPFRLYAYEYTLILWICEHELRKKLSAQIACNQNKLALISEVYCEIDCKMSLLLLRKANALFIYFYFCQHRWDMILFNLNLHINGLPNCLHYGHKSNVFGFGIMVVKTKQQPNSERERANKENIDWILHFDGWIEFTCSVFSCCVDDGLSSARATSFHFFSSIASISVSNFIEFIIIIIFVVAFLLFVAGCNFDSGMLYSLLVAIFCGGLFANIPFCCEQLANLL